MGSRGRNAEREEENGLYAKSISIGTKFAARGCQVTGVTRGRARVLPERGMSTGANEGRRGWIDCRGRECYRPRAVRVGGVVVGVDDSIQSSSGIIGTANLKPFNWRPVLLESRRFNLSMVTGERLLAFLPGRLVEMVSKIIVNNYVRRACRYIVPSNFIPSQGTEISNYIYLGYGLCIDSRTVVLPIRYIF